MRMWTEWRVDGLLYTAVICIVLLYSTHVITRTVTTAVTTANQQFQAATIEISAAQTKVDTTVKNLLDLQLRQAEILGIERANAQQIRELEHTLKDDHAKQASEGKTK